MNYRLKKAIANFFSSKHIIGLRFLLFLEIMILLLSVLMVQSLELSLNLWSFPAFCVSLVIWIISSLLDYRKYFNLATLIVTGQVTYFIFLLLFKAI